MTTLAERIRAAAADVRFSAPATDAQIAAAELALGLRLPAWLHELYRTTDGIRPAGEDHFPYLYPLQGDGPYPSGLVEWNQFVRDEWRTNLPDYEAFRPDVDWAALDPDQLLVIGCDVAITWAVRLDGGTTVLHYSVGSDQPPEAIAADLAAACDQAARAHHELDENLFRGREVYRDQSDAAPTACDVDQLLITWVSLHRPADIPDARIGTGGTLMRATSQRAGEVGALFVFPLAGDDEVRIATADGNLPFVMCLTAHPFGPAFACAVCTVDDAVDRIRRTVVALQVAWTAGERPGPSRTALDAIWQDGPGPVDGDLRRAAGVLFNRDDQRRSEENRLGTPIG